MSKQAFDKLMGQLPDEDKKAIYAAAAAYGLDFESPEWIPFAISQHGLLAIQHAIEDLGAAVKEGSDHAIRQAMKAIHAAKDAELSEVEKAAAEIGAGLRKTAADGRQSLEAQAVKMTAQLTEQLTRTLQATAADIIARQVDPLNRAQQSLTRTVEAANARMAAAGRWFGAKAVVLALALTLIVGLAAWGLVGWERHEVSGLLAQQVQLQATIAQEQATVAALDKRGGRVRWSTCDGRLCFEVSGNQGQDSSGNPTPLGGWTTNGGKVALVIPRGY
ncbi:MULTISPECIES: hypothetical protein [Betaproteobacteria]|jgi:hypothetical protein|uniref:Uncharacterized protein n=1 Tax=Thiomonas intermedia (strain K12) TaxID=75379 RepID=D5X718_THIK1|nr:MULTISPECIES: hypothetical protein [Betaproteobacteria]OZB69356.1 MAG: hypothetical protein B7X30_13305 [Thiomonas sp. 13-64-67]